MGREGCYIAGDGISDSEAWLPALHEDQEKVVDPTGGGNAFLGAMAITIARCERPHDGLFPILQGAVSGTVAASFAIEQIGAPVVAVGEDGETMVNGESVVARSSTFRARARHSGYPV